MDGLFPQCVFILLESSTRDFYSSTFQNSNLYIGDEEIKYATTFLTLTSDLPLDLRATKSSLFSSTVRSYKLESNQLILEYFFNTQLTDVPTVVYPTNTLQEPALAEWLDVESGTIIKEENVLPGQQITSPPFAVDSLLRVKKIEK